MTSLHDSFPIKVSDRSSIDKGSVPTLKKPSKSIQKIIDLKTNISHHEVTIDGNEYQIKFRKKGQDQSETGSAEQMKVKLIGAQKLYGRFKQIQTLNEAIIYHKITASDDPLKSFLPSYLGVFDEKGNKIDVEEELKTQTVKQLCKKYPTAYLLMNDLTASFSQEEQVDTTRPTDDFKFIKPSLLINAEEVKKHARTKRSGPYKYFRKVFFSYSNCSFGFQKDTKSHWYSWLIVNIKRVITLSKTKERIKSQFASMDREELIKTKEKLLEFKDTLQTSNFTFADASLLFIPTTKMVDEKEVRSCNITLIDLSHGISQDEEIKNFDTMQKDMANSLLEMIAMLDEVIAEMDKKAEVSLD